MKYTISKGFTQNERAKVAALYWEAFSAKLHYVMGPESKALTFLSGQLNTDFALIARETGGNILGVAGFKTAKGALVGGKISDIARVYGWFSACWRGPLLGLVERDLQDGTLLMDGICVAPQARGLGLGTALLGAIKDETRAQGCTSLRLDVIDTNPRARALYERQGFVATSTEHLGPLRHIFGFASSTKMIWHTNTP